MESGRVGGTETVEQENDMSYKLREVVFRVRCGEPGCPFTSDFSIKENLMGATEADIDSEAWKIARNQAYNKHDAVYGRKHPLVNPDIKKVSGLYDRIGPAEDAAPVQPRTPPLPSRVYRKGEKIIRKGDKAGTICEVLRGSAVNESRPDLVYRVGSTFGFAALLENKDRMADIVAGEDGTLIACHNLKDLTRSDPVKARSIYNDVMEDIFRVVEYLEDLSNSLEKQNARLKAENDALKARRPVAVAGGPAKKPTKRGIGRTAKKPVRKPVKKPVKKAVKKTTKPAHKGPKRKPAVRKVAQRR